MQMLKMLMAPMLIMGLNQLGLDYSKPEVLLGARVLFGAVQGVMLLLYLYILSRVKKANDQSVITVTKPPGFRDAMQAASAQAQGGAAARPTGSSKNMTVKEYDTEQVMAQLKQILLGTAITVFIHYKWGYVQPLILQAVMGPMNVFGAPLVSIHVLGQPAVGKLQRPFKQDNPADPFGLMKSMQPQQDDADTDAASTPAAAGATSASAAPSGPSGAAGRKKRKDT